MTQEYENFRTAWIRRYDDDHLIRYFTYLDFPGMRAEPFSFSSLGERVEGNFYSYPGARADDLVLFCHGLGGGHRSYMREIEMLCRAGFTVAAYDNVGCFASSGESILGISASVFTVDGFFSFLSASERSFRRITAVGHSWGGFTAGASLSRHHEIEKAVLLSPFDTVKDAVCAVASPNEKALSEILSREYADFPAAECLSVAASLACANVPALLIASKDDGMIPLRYGINAIRERSHCEKISCVFTENRKHNPNYTEAAVNTMNAVFAEYLSKVSDGTLKTFEEKKAFLDAQDWFAITEQDPEMWDKILDFLR